MTKKHALGLAATPIVFCCFFISLSGVVRRPTILLKTEAQKLEGDLSSAAALFRESKYSEALPLLERLANANPSDDQAIFGLGVALIYAADSETDFEKRKQLVIRARQKLIKAEELGVDDFLLALDLKDLPADGVGGEETLATFAVFWVLHPPMVFDNTPPEGIKLPDGYRHKASTNFEGATAGIIWKKDGIKIEYEFAYWAGGDPAVKEIKEFEQVWRRKTQSEDLEFEYVLKKDNRLIVSSYREGNKFANFFVKVRSEQDVEEVLSIIKGLKPKKR
jgi:hypothetical protein